MQTFAILKGTFKGKHISIIEHDKYYDLYKKKHTGAIIKIYHHISRKKDLKFRWVQTLASNDPEWLACGFKRFVDPFHSNNEKYSAVLPGIKSICKADDLKPFYFIDKNNKFLAPVFTDEPHSIFPKSGKYWYKFTTALAHSDGFMVTQLVSITWGYSLTASGQVVLYPIKRASTAQKIEHTQVLKKFYNKYKFSYL